MNDTFNLANKVAIVTGAGSGLGKACAEALAMMGAKVAVTDINSEDAQTTTNKILSLGGNAIFFGLDVTNSTQFKEVVDQVVEKHGKIDVLVNNAGINRRNLVKDMPEEDWKAIIDINLTGVWIGAKAVIPTMISQNNGKIINMASGMAYTAMPNMSAYCASKAGVVQLTKVLALELTEYNIQVNAVAPGYVLTKLTEKLKNNPEMYNYLLSKTPMGRFGEPEEIAAVVLFLASDSSSYVMGTTINVDGGWTAQ